MYGLLRQVVCHGSGISRQVLIYWQYMYMCQHKDLCVNMLDYLYVRMTDSVSRITELQILPG